MLWRLEQVSSRHKRERHDMFDLLTAAERSELLIMMCHAYGTELLFTDCDVDGRTGMATEFGGLVTELAR